MESVENISTVTVDNDDLVSLHLVLTPTQDSQGQGQPGISTPPVLPLTPAAAPDSRTPILHGGGPVIAPGPARVPQPRAPVQLGGAGATPRRAALHVNPICHTNFFGQSSGTKTQGWMDDDEGDNILLVEKQIVFIEH